MKIYIIDFILTNLILIFNNYIYLIKLKKQLSKLFLKLHSAMILIIDLTFYKAYNETMKELAKVTEKAYRNFPFEENWNKIVFFIHSN